MYLFDIAFVLLVIGILCTYRIYCLIRWAIDLRNRKRAKQ